MPLPPSGVEQAAEHADGRRLAAAVGAEEAADLARGDLQIEALHDLAGAEAFRSPRTSMTSSLMARAVSLSGPLSGARPSAGRG